jgi:hypothetical protein
MKQLQITSWYLVFLEKLAVVQLDKASEAILEIQSCATEALIWALYKSS